MCDFLKNTLEVLFNFNTNRSAIVDQRATAVDTDTVRYCDDE